MARKIFIRINSCIRGEDKLSANAGIVLDGCVEKKVIKRKVDVSIQLKTAKKTMILFIILWGIDAMAALVALYFFYIGLGDGTVNTRNMAFWLSIIAGLAVILLGSIWLRASHYPGLAIAVLLILGIPTLLYLIFILIMACGNGRWN